MKRSIIALIMALAMILTLVACGNSNGDNNNGGNDVKAIQLSLGHTNNTDHHYQVLAESFKKIVADVKTVSESEASDLKFIEEQGVTITYPDLTAFEEALAPVTESYCKQYGDEFTALYNQLKG